MSWAPAVARAENIPNSATVLLQGQPLTFFAGENLPLPSLATLRAQWTADGVDDDGSSRARALLGAGTTPRARIYAALDGTQFLVYLWHEKQIDASTRRTGYRAILLQGPNAVWVKQEDFSTVYFTNRTGDRVSVVDSIGTTQGGRNQIVITNERNPAHTITGTLTLAGEEVFTDPETGRQTPLGHLAHLKVANTLGLPTADLSGRFRARTGFLPETLTESAGEESRVMAFSWLTSPEGLPLGRLEALKHPNGLVEAFTYSSGPDAFPALETISTLDASGVGDSIWIRRNLPGSGGGRSTLVLRYADPTPGVGPYRGVKLGHLDRGATGKVADYLSGTSAILREDHFSGTGDCDPASIANIHETRIFDGWSLRCWANPQGIIQGSSPQDQPVQAVPLRTRIYPSGLPSTLRVVGHPLLPGSRDAWGTLRTDTWTYAGPQPVPSLDRASNPCLEGDLAVPTGYATCLTHIQTRIWNPVLGILQVITDGRSLDLSGGPTLRYGLDGGGGLKGLTGIVDLGTTTLTYDPRGFITTVRRAGRDSLLTETRLPWSESLPLIGSTTQTLRVGGAFIPAAPGQNLSVGQESVYDSSPFQWLTGERDRVDGRWTTYAVDDLGRRTLTTDFRGVQVQTTYDEWGRVRSKTHLGKGVVGPVSTDVRYDICGTWKMETVTSDGHSLTTHAELDGWGRTVKVTFPDGSIQRTVYDGFGQKVRQTPVLKARQQSYGDVTWAYDGQGRLAETRDRVTGPGTGRVLIRTLAQPAWIGGGIRTTLQDPEGHRRVICTDVLGQRIASTDPLGQTVRYFHDQDGRLLLTRQGVQTRTFVRNELGWLTSTVEPEEGTTHYSGFTQGGQPTLVMRRGRSGSSPTRIETELDAYLRPKTVRTTSPQGFLERTYAYDETTRLLRSLTETQPQGILKESYAYDDLGRLTGRTTGDGTQSFSIVRTLYDCGYEKTLTFPAANGYQTVATSLDALNRVQDITLDRALRAQMSYDDQGSGTSVSQTLVFGNGVTSDFVWNQGDLACVTHHVRGMGPDLQPAAWSLSGNQQVNHLGWSPGGLLLWRGPDDQNVPGNNGFPSLNDAFSYDPNGRLLQTRILGLHPGECLIQSFGYDLYGNRNASTFQYHAGSGGTQPEEVAFWVGTPEPGSNQLPGTVTGPGGEGVTGAVYDDFGRLTSVLAVPNGQGDFVTSWDYDAGSRIVREVVAGEVSTFLLDACGLRFRRSHPDGSMDYTLYDFSRRPLALFRQAGSSRNGSIGAAGGPPVMTWVRSSIHGFGQIISEETHAGTSYIQSDLVGSPNLLTNGSGILVGITKNLPFGEGFGWMGARSASRYATHESQPGSPVYMQARMYLPAYGRFAQVDPSSYQEIDDGESLNMYGYVRNNPVTQLDPDGEFQRDEFFRHPRPEVDMSWSRNERLETPLGGEATVEVLGSLPVNVPHLPGTNWALGTTVPGNARMSSDGSGRGLVPQNSPLKNENQGNLPATPEGLPEGWTHDPSHKDPKGERWRSPNGDDYLDFHPATPGAPGWRGKDHWHGNGEKKHLTPGVPWLYGAAIVGVGFLIIATDGAAVPLLLAF